MSILKPGAIEVDEVAVRYEVVGAEQSVMNEYLLNIYINRHKYLGKTNIPAQSIDNHKNDTIERRTRRRPRQPGRYILVLSQTR